MRIVQDCAECEGGRSLMCATCDGAGIGTGDEGTYGCTVCGGSGYVRCLSCDGPREERSSWLSWRSAGEVQSAT